MPQPPPQPDRASRLYRLPQQPLPPGAASRGHRHLIRAGCLHAGSAPGTLALCPLLCRSLDKLTRLVHARMAGLGAQRLTLPMLGAAAIWQRTGRWEEMGSEMFRLTDRQDRRLCLQPTHEEEATRLVAMAAQQMPKRSLPLLLYQLHWKFRDEPCPKHGLLRAREFLMKDLYSFHADEECARRTYEKVCQAYADLLGTDLGLPWLRAVASAGRMGGAESAEFHVPAAPGEDRLRRCLRCEPAEGGVWRNADVVVDVNDCQSPLACSAESTAGLEVGHCFLLGRDRYPKAFQLPAGMTMACYGIGVSRLLGACVEATSTEEALRWPAAIAPYSLALVCPKAGARERLSESASARLTAAVQSRTPDLLLLDDRDHLTIGARLRDHRLWGLPRSLVVKSAGGERIACELLDNYVSEAEPLRWVADSPEEAATAFAGTSGAAPAAACQTGRVES